MFQKFKSYIAPAKKVLLVALGLTLLSACHQHGRYTNNDYGFYDPYYRVDHSQGNYGGDSRHQKRQHNSGRGHHDNTSGYYQNTPPRHESRDHDTRRHQDGNRDGYRGGSRRDNVCDPDGDRCYRSEGSHWDYREYYRRHGYEWTR